MKCNLDHLVIGAENLAQGVNYIKSELGVDIPYGGEHPLMGTHNHLMQLGNDVFLEVIAINPVASKPAQPRWYGLDDVEVQEKLSIKPSLLAWVVNTPDIVDLLRRTHYDFGQPTRLSRGDLNWFFSLPENGRLLEGGLVPYVIQWNTAVHPARSMADLNAQLISLEIHLNPTGKVIEMLDTLDSEPPVKVSVNSKKNQMLAYIKTDDGIKTLESLFC